MVPGNGCGINLTPRCVRVSYDRIRGVRNQGTMVILIVRWFEVAVRDLVDRSHVHPLGFRFALLRSLFTEEPYAFLEPLPVGDVPVTETFVAEVCPECDEEVVVLRIGDGLQIRCGVGVVLGEAFGEVFEQIAADVFATFESVPRDHSLYV